MRNESLRLGVFFGGPSQERGISINSARSFVDHTRNFDVALKLVYVSPSLEFVAIDPTCLYQNTPLDFDFLLSKTSSKWSVLSESDVLELVRTCNLLVPAGHGAFFEDGQIQTLFEEWGIPFVGSASKSCSQAFDKGLASSLLKQFGFNKPTPSCTFDLSCTQYKSADIAEVVHKTFGGMPFTGLVLKPTSSGSSLGVHACDSLEALMQAIRECEIDGYRRLLLQENYKRMGYREFSVIVLQNHIGTPVALCPCAIDCEGIFDYRAKYLPTDRVRLETPMRASHDLNMKIRKDAEEIFKTFELRDFARLDGWLSKDGSLIWSDINIISGMEQTSFLFQQAAMVGLDHSETIRTILNSACARYGMSPIPTIKQAAKTSTIRVLFGGGSSERQVSLQSGTNVFLKLNATEDWQAEPYLIFFDTVEMKHRIVRPPYPFCLFHTVEEVVAACNDFSEIKNRLTGLASDVENRLVVKPSSFFSNAPRSMSLSEFVQDTISKNESVFLATHGDIGENGVLQGMLAANGICFTGSKASTSWVCMDKAVTGEIIQGLNDPGILTCHRERVYLAHLMDRDDDFIVKTWENITRKLPGTSFICKPNSDGCSTGVIQISSGIEFLKYVRAILNQDTTIPKGTFLNQADDDVLLPSKLPDIILVEEMIRKTKTEVTPVSVTCDSTSDWIEVTVAVIRRNNDYLVFQPTLTVSRSEVLSLAEKFQAGTGVNLTPPPQEIVSFSNIELARESVRRLCKAFEIDGVARIDAFLNRTDGRIIVIEINTIPGMTPSTVLFHQGLAENSPIFPHELLSMVANGVKKVTKPCRMEFPQAYRKHLHECIDDNINSGYGALAKWEYFHEAVDGHGALGDLMANIYSDRPEMSPLNFVSTLAGAINYLQVEPDDSHASTSRSIFDGWVKENYSQILDLSVKRNNNPTVPQRAAVVQHYLNRKFGNSACGLLELGCSRGDIGAVLLNWNYVATRSSEYFFPSYKGHAEFSDSSQMCQVVRYLGVDLNVNCEDRWLLSLWGKNDPRVKVLKSFYRDFPPLNRKDFLRVEGNATSSDSYADLAVSWFSNVERVVVLTSYLAYQLTPSERQSLASAIYQLKSRFQNHRQARERIDVHWINVDLSAEKWLTDSWRINEVFMTEIHVAQNGYRIKSIAELANDLGDEWKFDQIGSRDVLWDSI
jgi:D-alanine--D-alanine ligase